LNLTILSRQFFPHSHKLNSQFLLLSLHIFSNISLALSEGLLDDVVDSFLQVFELGSYDFMNSVIEVINFNIDGVYLVFEFDGEALEAMG